MKRFDIKATPKIVVEAAEKEGFKIRCQDASDGKPAELALFDSIGKDGWGDGISAAEVRDFRIRNQSKPIDLVINSFGGSFYEGLVMYNELIEHDAPVTARIKGIAYSAATLPAMAADKMIMSKRSDFGIHQSWTVAVGNKREMLSVYEWLVRVDNHQLSIYQEKVGESDETINAWLEANNDDGTVFSAQEALDVGFADEIEDARHKNSSSAELSQAKAMWSAHRQKIKMRMRMLTSNGH